MRFIVVVLASLAVLLALLCNSYWLKTFTSALTLSIAVAGTALLYGQLGLVSLCQYALVAVGGWVALRLSHGLGLPFELCVLAGGLSASAAGMVVGSLGPQAVKNRHGSHHHVVGVASEA